MSDAAEQLVLLADPTRRALVDRLGPDGATATTLAAALPVSRQAVVKHLQSMTAAGLLTRQKVGRDVVYRVAPEALQGISGWFEDLGRQWEGRLGALKRAAEAGDREVPPAHHELPPAPGDVIWFEIWVDDLDHARRFYASLFGWRFQPLTEYDPETHWLIQKDSGAGTIGALARRSPDQRAREPSGASSSTIVYVKVEDVEVSTALAEAEGGSVVERSKVIGTVDGEFSIVADAAGNRIGLWAP